MGRSGNPAVRAVMARPAVAVEVPEGKPQRVGLGTAYEELERRRRTVLIAQEDCDRLVVDLFKAERSRGASAVEAARRVGYERTTFWRRFGL